ncbi:MAG: 3-deoxy-manno-octulosonate cytidylyltransferase [Betaproteobacteria bacterium]|nr:3-deoxy-manno-octulosonate cytidylyltransferase [Betaproteobacteria bacterium]
MSFRVIIPARLASTRLPDKPLADLAGLPMVVRVAQQAQHSSAAQVVVAADDDRIVQACREHGVMALLTRQDHPSGSDRVAQACALLGCSADEVVVNLQGDEPLMDPELLDACARTLQDSPACVMATAAHPLDSEADWLSPNVVKVVLDARGRAMYFSRSPLPAWRDRRSGQALYEAPSPVLRHIGLYAYRAGFLLGFPELAPSPLEQSEMLEQLRVLWHGFGMAVHVTDRCPHAGVDTPQDLERVRRHLVSQL